MQSEKMATTNYNVVLPDQKYSKELCMVSGHVCAWCLGMSVLPECYHVFYFLVECGNRNL